MVDTAFRDQLTASPALYPVAVDPRADAVQLARLTRADYAAASFLDARVLTSGVRTGWGPWADLREAAAGQPERCHFIFHISHVGSTLLSRLLGQHPAVFSLREPAILRNLADAHLALGQPDGPWSRSEFDQRLGVYLGLWSRTFELGQTALLKATSFVNEMAEHLLERLRSARAILMFVSPLTFLKALLDGAMSDITNQAAKRLFRLNRRLDAACGPSEQLSTGECVAMSWLCEMMALQVAADRFSGRVLWLDFDHFLAAPEDRLAAALGHLGVEECHEEVGTILAGPTMTQYAKAPAEAFDAQYRRQLLERSERRHGAEIGKGLAWLERAAATFPAAQRALARADWPRLPTS
jgi:hypothetical protein